MSNVKWLSGKTWPENKRNHLSDTLKINEKFGSSVGFEIRKEVKSEEEGKKQEGEGREEV